MPVANMAQSIPGWGGVGWWWGGVVVVVGRGQMRQARGQCTLVAATRPPLLLACSFGACAERTLGDCVVGGWVMLSLTNLPYMYRSGLDL